MDAGTSFRRSGQLVFHATFLTIAENSELEFVSFSADVKEKLEKLEGQGFIMAEVLLRPKLSLATPATLNARVAFSRKQKRTV